MSRRKASCRVSRGSYRIGKVTVYFRSPSWWIYFRESGKTRRIRIGRDRKEAEFLEACPPWEFRVFFTLAFTGMRPGELAHLLIDDVSFETKTVFIRNHHELGWCTKTRNERRVYLFDELRHVSREAVGCRTGRLRSALIAGPRERPAPDRRAISGASALGSAAVT